METTQAPPSGDLRQQIEAQLATCRDPEIGLDIMSLGLVYEVIIDEGSVLVKMTLTAIGCPWAQDLFDEVKTKVEEVPGVKACTVDGRSLTDLLPGFAADVFGRGSAGLAMLLSFHGGGAMLGAMWISARGGLRGLTNISLVNILLMALALVLFVATDHFWFACPMVGLIGFAFIVQSVTNQTLIQSAVESAFRGRVMSIYGMVNQGVPAIGAMAIGGAAEHFGLRVPVLAGALGAAALFFWAWRARKPMAASLEDAAGPAPPPRPSPDQL